MSAKIVRCLVCLVALCVLSEAAEASSRSKYKELRDEIVKGLSRAWSGWRKQPCKAYLRLKKYGKIYTASKRRQWRRMPRRYRKRLFYLGRRSWRKMRGRTRYAYRRCKRRYGRKMRRRLARLKPLIEQEDNQSKGTHPDVVVLKPVSRAPPVARPADPTPAPTPTVRPNTRQPPAMTFKSEPRRAPAPRFRLPTPTRRDPVASPPPRNNRVAQKPIDGPGSGITKKATPPAPGGIAPPLQASAGLRMFSRTFFYHEDIFAALNPYNLLMAPALQVDFRWYPLAHVMKGIPTLIGLVGHFHYALGLGSKTPDGTLYQTTALGFHIGLCGRIPIGPVQIHLSASYGQQLFEVGQPEPRLIPVVGYQWARLEGGVRWAVNSAFAIQAHFAYRAVFEAGEIKSSAFFPNLDVGGIDGDLNLIWSITRNVGLRAGIQLTHYFFSMNPEVGDAKVAGGAIDQYLSFDLGVVLQI